LQGDDGLLRQLENAEERWVGVGGDVIAVEVVDPDLLSGVQLADASRVAGLVASIVSWRGVGSDRVDARPTLQECVVVDHHRETAACCRVVIQYLAQYRINYSEK